MVGSRAYDVMYRFWAPWDAAGVRDDLVRLLDSGVVAPPTHPRAIDLGCGTGANVVHLAERGHDVVGVDFSDVALRKARGRAQDHGVAQRCTFLRADLTSDALPRQLGTFDVLIDFGTLDDLHGDARNAMAHNIAALARPGAVFLLWCFYAARESLPVVSFRGPSRLTPSVEPGEERALFGDSFDIEVFGQPSGFTRAFVMHRRNV